jgi:intracellular multiplication protein IcmE
MAEIKSRKSLFSSTRTRVIVLFTLSIVALAVIFALISIHNADTQVAANANLSNVPGSINSIPGSLNQTIQYAGLQQQQNIDQAKAAEKSGASSIPTIIRAQAFGVGENVGAQQGTGGLDFTALSRGTDAGKPKDVWFDSLKNSSCSRDSVRLAMEQGATAEDLKAACSCTQLKMANYPLTSLHEICSCEALRPLGVTILEFKNNGWNASELRQCGFTACQEKGAGFSALAMKRAGYSDGELKGAGFPEAEIQRANGLPDGINAADLRNAGCSVAALTKEREKGVSAAAIRRIVGCSAQSLLAAGYTPKDLRDAGFSAADLRAAGLTPEQLKKAGYSGKDLLNAGFTPQQLLASGFTPKQIAQAQDEVLAAKELAAHHITNCSKEDLLAAHKDHVSAQEIVQTLGCSAAALKAAGYSAADLKNAGFTPAELKNAGFSPEALKAAGFTAHDLANAGFTPAELKNAGYSPASLLDAGFTPEELRKAGVSAAELKAAGVSAEQLKKAGFTPEELRNAGFSAKELQKAGLTPAQLRQAGFTPDELKQAGILPNTTNATNTTNAGAAVSESDIPGVPSLPGVLNKAEQAKLAQEENNKRLAATMARQHSQMIDQKYQQKIQQRTSSMVASASQMLQSWKVFSKQQYEQTSVEKNKVTDKTGTENYLTKNDLKNDIKDREALIEIGDVLFAVIDTAVNSDEPGPILATIVSGPLTGAKLIGSFTLPENADKMVISFNTLSVPGAAGSVAIHAFAIDPNTARTALSSETNHHYLTRYSALFASTFLEGFGNAFQSADTTITIGGTGGTTDTTVQNGIGRSALENAVIGLATVGKAWGQVAQQNMSRPTTVQVFSGTGVGVLFTQDVKSI